VRVRPLVLPNPAPGAHGPPAGSTPSRGGAGSVAKLLAALGAEAAASAPPGAPSGGNLGVDDVVGVEADDDLSDGEATPTVPRAVRTSAVRSVTPLVCDVPGVTVVTIARGLSTNALARSILQPDGTGGSASAAPLRAASRAGDGTVATEPPVLVAPPTTPARVGRAGTLPPVHTSSFRLPVPVRVGGAGLGGAGPVIGVGMLAEEEMLPTPATGTGMVPPERTIATPVLTRPRHIRAAAAAAAAAAAGVEVAHGAEAADAAPAAAVAEAGDRRVMTAGTMLARYLQGGRVNGVDLPDDSGIAASALLPVCRTPKVGTRGVPRPHTGTLHALPVDAVLEASPLAAAAAAPRYMRYRYQRRRRRRRWQRQRGVRVGGGRRFRLFDTRHVTFVTGPGLTPYR